MRTRSIPPAFWEDPRITGMTRDARLLLAGVWCYVDDEGRAKDSLAILTDTLFGSDTDTAWISDAFSELVSGGWVVRYTANGARYVHVPEFSAWQKPNRPSRSKHPVPDLDTTSTTDTLTDTLTETVSDTAVHVELSYDNGTPPVRKIQPKPRTGRKAPAWDDVLIGRNR